MDKATRPSVVNKSPWVQQEPLAGEEKNASNLHVKFGPNPLPDGSILRLISFGQNNTGVS